MTFWLRLHKANEILTCHQASLEKNKLYRTLNKSSGFLGDPYRLSNNFERELSRFDWTKFMSLGENRF